jgi:hypothetical protein
MRETPKLLAFVRERLHAQPAAIYPTTPFSKRQPARVAKAEAAMRTERASALQLTASKTVFSAQAALPLMQQVQLQSSQFQSGFSASAYRTRFTGFGGGGLF